MEIEFMSFRWVCCSGKGEKFCLENLEQSDGGRMVWDSIWVLEWVSWGQIKYKKVEVGVGEGHCPAEK